MLAKLRRLKFGRSAEVLDTQISQLELALEELETKRSTLSGRPVSSIEHQKPVRRALPENLPREEIVHAAPVAQDCTCNECGGALREMGEDTSEVLEYVPSRFKVIRHVRPKLACSRCQKILQAPAPSRPIERGLAGPALLAHVLVSKYCDIFRSIARAKSMHAKAWSWIDPRLLIGWAVRADY
jgi:transposase